MTYYTKTRVKMTGSKILLLVLFVSGIFCQDESWQLGPFAKEDHINPIMGPLNHTTFFCPLRQENVTWESKDIFNPGAIIKDGKVHMLYRAEDYVGLYNGTSRIGLAVSNDGLKFKRLPEPVFYPNNDTHSIYEWEGGCEDPRVVEFNSTYFMTYTGYDGELARLMVASSRDLEVWTKHGSVFAQVEEGKFVDMWSKAGSIVTELKAGKQEAVRINGRFWMYFGETDIFAATSDDLINWVPITDDVNGTENEFNLTTVLGPRIGKFDSDIVEPGPPAILTQNGIVLVYNSRNLDPELGGDPTLPRGTYSAGQVLINATNPLQVVSRLENYFFTPDRDYEVIGQVNNVVFLEGLVFHNGMWLLYYGTADSKIAVATIRP